MEDIIDSAASPNTARNVIAPPAAGRSPAEPAVALVARYVLVEDIDHLLRTGESRRALALRWTRQSPLGEGSVETA